MVPTTGRKKPTANQMKKEPPLIFATMAAERPQKNRITTSVSPTTALPHQRGDRPDHGDHGDHSEHHPEHCSYDADHDLDQDPCRHQEDQGGDDLHADVSTRLAHFAHM